MKRVYKTVSIRRIDGAGYEILLDKKPIKTPKGREFVIATERLANAIAREWDDQAVEIEAEKMPLTRLTSITQDWTAEDSEAAIPALLEFLKTDLLCYRATEPQELVSLQSHRYDPLLDWFEERFGQSMLVVHGVMPASQPDEVIEAVGAQLRAKPIEELMVLQIAAPLTSSLIVPLALAEGRITGLEAYEIACLDDLYQIRKWGRDKEAVSRLEVIKAELKALQGYLFLVE